MLNIRTLFRIMVGFLSGALILALAPSVAVGGLSANEARLAIKGYDPVAYFTMGRPVPGKPEFAITTDGVRYQFANSEHREMFRNDIDRYMPQYRGLCAMGLAVKGYKVEANPENWVIYNGRLFVTQAAYGPPGFRRNPEGSIVLANRNVEALAGRPVGSALAWW